MQRLLMLGAALMLACAPAQAQTMVKLKAGMVTGIDFTGTEPVLLIGSIRVNISGVTSIRTAPPAASET